MKTGDGGCNDDRRGVRHVVAREHGSIPSRVPVEKHREPAARLPQSKRQAPGISISIRITTARSFIGSRV
jgi:hypothetical protein